MRSSLPSRPSLPLPRGEVSSGPGCGAGHGHCSLKCSLGVASAAVAWRSHRALGIKGALPGWPQGSIKWVPAPPTSGLQLPGPIGAAWFEWPLHGGTGRGQGVRVLSSPPWQAASVRSSAASICSCRCLSCGLHAAAWAFFSRSGVVLLFSSLGFTFDLRTHLWLLCRYVRTGALVPPRLLTGNPGECHCQPGPRGRTRGPAHPGLWPCGLGVRFCVAVLLEGQEGVEVTARFPQEVPVCVWVVLFCGH